MDDRQKEDLRYTVVSDSMIVLKSPLMTTQEIVESVRKLAIINWGDEAKAKLAEIGFVTDEDLHNYMKKRFERARVEDPDPNNVEFYGVDIIED